jgi:hypothetical protein
MESIPRIQPLNIVHQIQFIRGEKVLLDYDLAALYDVSTKVLKQAVRRNQKRFPGDFMFELTRSEFDHLRSHFVTSSWGGQRYLPYAFTEQGVAMLSGVLNSDRAIRVNIVIMRAFVHLRKFLDSNKELARKVEELEMAVFDHDDKIQMIFTAIKELIEEKENPPERTPIGFRLQ